MTHIVPYIYIYIYICMRLQRSNIKRLEKKLESKHKVIVSEYDDDYDDQYDEQVNFSKCPFPFPFGFVLCVTDIRGGGVHILAVTFHRDVVFNVVISHYLYNVMPLSCVFAPTPLSLSRCWPK
jgi:hypothetical protein